MTGRLPVLLDCDPGHDDAFAIWLAARHCNLVGVTTVHGNQSLDKVTRNAAKVLDLAGLHDVLVYAGASEPLVAPATYAPGIHGESGLDGPALPEPSRTAEQTHAVDFISEASRQHDGLVLVATGPLTNVALALRRDPPLRDRIAEISLMGGSLTYGNVTPAAEFNIWADPEAARIVFRSGIPLRMVGLNLTRQAQAGPDEIARFRRLGTPVATVAAELVEFYAAQVKRLFGLQGASLHDPCAVAWLIEDELISGRDMHVDVELDGTLTRGMTVCDYRHIGAGDVEAGDATVSRGQPPNARVGETLDVARFFDLVDDVLSYFPHHDA